MSRGSINKVILIGRLGSDPEVRYTPSGAAVANFNVATNRGYKDKEGNWKDETDWHRVVVWNRTAEFCKEYVKKGYRVYVEGRLQTRSWEDQSGQKRFTTEVVALDVQLLESQQQSGASAGNAGAPMEMEPPTDMEISQDDVPF